jgi:hypothetical protein
VTRERETEQAILLGPVRSVQRAVSRKTEILKQPLLRETCMGKSLVTFKDTRPVSSKKGDLLYGIPVTLRQQQCWKFASAGRNVGTSWFHKLGCQNAAFSENRNTLVALLQSEMFGR